MAGKMEQPDTGPKTTREMPKSTTEQFNSSLLQKATPEYLQELLMDKKQLQNMPNRFKHVELILEKEIAQVRERLFHKNGSIQMNNTDLPDPSGQIITLQRKVYIPVKENPTYNFVGRLLGPRGLTAKQMEQDLGCKIMVRGKGSMRDKRKEDQNRGKPNWEHLQEDLHVLVSVEDYENRAELRLQRAVNAITIFLEQGLRTPEDKDLLKQTQLMELAVLNDKERQQAQVQQMTQQQQQQQFLLQQQYLSVLSSQSAMAAAAALSQSPAAQFLGPSGLRFAVPTTSHHQSTAAAAAAAAAVAANPLFLGTNPASTAVAPSTPSATVAAMNLAAAVMGGASAISPSTSTAAGTVTPIGAALSSDQLAALLGVANGAVSPSSMTNADTSGQSVAALAAGFPSTFPTLLPCTPANPANSTAGVIMPDYSNPADFENSSGSLKLRNNTVPAVRMHPYLRQ